MSILRKKRTEMISIPSESFGLTFGNQLMDDNQTADPFDPHTHTRSVPIFY